MLIFDTNVWISYALAPSGRFSATVAQGIAKYPYAFSNATFTELTDVLMRNKFDPWFSRENRATLLEKIAFGAEWFQPVNPVILCRDHSDNKFLELAVVSHALYLVTGDDDLRVLDPFGATRILSVSGFQQALDENPGIQ